MFNVQKSSFDVPLSKRCDRNRWPIGNRESLQQTINDLALNEKKKKIGIWKKKRKEKRVSCSRPLGQSAVRQAQLTKNRFMPALRHDSAWPSDATLEACGPDPSKLKGPPVYTVYNRGKILLFSTKWNIGVTKLNPDEWGSVPWKKRKKLPLYSQWASINKLHVHSGLPIKFNRQ